MNSSLRSTKLLQRLFGTPEAEILDAKDCVAATHACFAKTLEATLKHELGEDFYRKKLDELKAKYDIGKDTDAQKSPAVMFDQIAERQQKAKRPTLVSIVNAIFEMTPAPVQAAE